MNKEELLEKIEYLTSMPHSSLVEHCIYLENENNNYKAQKYITDFISENGIICKKNKEIEKLQQENKELSEMCELYSKSLYNAELTDYKARINKATEYIKETIFNYNTKDTKKLLEILGDKE